MVEGQLGPCATIWKPDACLVALPRSCEQRGTRGKRGEAGRWSELRPDPHWGGERRQGAAR